MIKWCKELQKKQSNSIWYENKWWKSEKVHKSLVKVVSRESRSEKSYSTKINSEKKEIALDTPKNSSLMDRLDNEELKEWSQNQPLSILRLDPIDRAILKISGKSSKPEHHLSSLSLLV